MKRQTDYTILALAIPVFLVTIMEVGCYESSIKKPIAAKVETIKEVIPVHTCPYVHCPYKNVVIADASEAIIEETGDRGTDSFVVDSLHFIHPSFSYDKLDSLTFSK